MHQIRSIETLLQKAEKEITDAKDSKALEKARVKFLGRKSKLTSILRTIKDLPRDKKAEVGQRANEAKERIEGLLNQQLSTINKQLLSNIAEEEWIDVTAPGEELPQRNINPLTQARWDTEEAFQLMGFEIVEPYEIDDDYHNFTSLNIPEGHPARDMWDTFWTEDGLIPITHTSSMQNRIIKSRKPPIRAVVPGTCFRNEATDPRHEHTLIQVEGIYLDKGITLSDMIGTLQTFFSRFFEKELKAKVIPSYFPFVEPGNAMLLSCVICNMKGCRLCNNSGWLEIMGCGMIHPYVIQEAGQDPNVYSGFAWGFGLDRIAMLKYGIEDIRLFRSGDLRLTQQF